jgi:hypothetical protein
MSILSYETSCCKLSIVQNALVLLSKLRVECERPTEMSSLGKHERDEPVEAEAGNGAAEESSEDEGPMPLPAGTAPVKKRRIVAHEKVYLNALPVCLPNNAIAMSYICLCLENRAPTDTFDLLCTETSCPIW